MKRFLGSLLVVLSALQALAWGPEGHRIIALVAYEYLTPKAVRQVDNVLGKNGMVYWSTWADEIRSDTVYPGSYDWHFQDLEAGMTDDEVASVLTDYPKQGGNLYRALDSLYLLLKNDKNNRDALRFYVHLSGDRYCPMHMGHISDKGGNTIKIKWFGTQTNLHRVWDEDLIRFRGYSVTEYAQLLLDMYGCERKAIEQASPEQLLINSYHITSAIYDYQKTWNGNVYNYVYHWKEPMERQLYTAGVRLAMILNDIYR